MRLALSILITAAVSLAAGDDPYCPAYSRSERISSATRLSLEKAATALSVQQRRLHAFQALANVNPYETVNLIDAYIFGKMAADGVEPAPKTSDQEILRRLYLDLTGRIPTADEASMFFQDDNPRKRSQLIEQLMNSEAFVDY